MAKNMAISLKNKEKKCNSIDDYVELAFSFSYAGHSILPFQLKDEIRILLEILSWAKPRTILEIGTANGGSLYLFSKVAPKNAKIITIDLPEGPFGGENFPNWKIPLYRSFVQNKQKIDIIREDSHSKQTFDMLKKRLGKTTIDFLFIDGDHSYKGVKKDFEMYSKLVAKDGFIAFHDISKGPEDRAGKVSNFWNKIKSKNQCVEITINDQTDGYGIGILLKQGNKGIEKFQTLLKIINNFQNQLLLKKNLDIAKNLHSLKSMVTKLTDEVKNKDIEINKTKNYVTKLENEFEDKDSEINKTKDYITKFEHDLANKNSEINKTKDYITKLEHDLADKHSEINKTKDYVKKLNQKIPDKEAELTKSHEYTTKLNQEIQAKEAELTKSHEYTTKLNQGIQDKEAELTKSHEYTTKLNQGIQDKEQEIKIGKNFTAKLSKEISDKNQYLKKLEIQIRQLQETIDEDSKNRLKYYSSRL